MRKDFYNVGGKKSDIEVRISYRIIQLFSEGLYSSPNKALEELVSNSFDAGATSVHVILPADFIEPEAAIVVVDDGIGMDEKGLTAHWLIGVSGKRDLTKLPKNRKQIGKFGIGKLATYVLANRLTHICKVGNAFFSTSMDYAKIPSGEGGTIKEEKVMLPLRTLTEKEAKEAVESLVVGTKPGFKAIKLFGSGAAKTWTIAVMSNLKPMATEIQQGRLRWILQTAMPLRDDFALYLNGDKVLPSKLAAKRVGHWILGKDLKEIPKPAPDNLVPTEDTKTSKEFRYGLTHPKLGRVTGYAEIYEDPLDTGKSTEIERSNGFFVYVRGRLVNIEDPGFGINRNLLRHGTFSRFRMVVHIDKLDDELRSSRESLRVGPLVSIAQNILHGVFNHARVALEKHEAEQSAAERISTGDNGSTTLLSWIAESGENASGTVVSLPSSTFTYQTQTAGWVSNSIWNPTISFTATSSADDGVRVTDVNGDGLPDIIQGYTDALGSTTDQAYINNGADWTVSSTWAPPTSFSINSGGTNVDQGVRIADVNGDGLPDIIQGFKDGSGVNHFAAYINTGSGWSQSSTWNPPVVFSNNGNDTGARIVDVNGDGLPDIIQGFSDTNGSTTYAAYLNNGAGWTQTNVWNPPTLFIATGTTDVGTRLADVNGDGLPDLIQAYTDGGGTSHYATYLNTGTGWNTTSTPLWNSPVVFANNGVDTGARIVDVNGDGLADIVQGYTDVSSVNHYAAYLNNGAGWSSATQWNPPIPLTIQNNIDNGARIVDVNGDGLPDIIQAYNDSSGVEHTSAYTNNNKFRADILTGVTYPQGGSAAIAYQSILQITDPLGNVLNGVPYPVYIVSSVSTNDGLGNIATSTYTYQGGTYFTNGPSDHEFAGFTQVKTTDPTGNVTKTYYDTSNGTSTSLGQYNDNFWKIGKAYRVENYDNAGNLYKATITKWDSTSTGGNAAYVFPDQMLEMDYDGLSTHQDLAESYLWSAATGNQTQKTQWGQVTGSSTGAFSTSTPGFVTTLSYASTTGSTVSGKVSDETLLNPSSTKIQETQYFYDGLTLGSVGVGNLTKQLDWIFGASRRCGLRKGRNNG